MQSDPTFTAKDLRNLLILAVIAWTLACLTWQVKVYNKRQDERAARESGYDRGTLLYQRHLIASTWHRNQMRPTQSQEGLR